MSSNFSSQLLNAIELEWVYALSGVKLLMWVGATSASYNQIGCIPVGRSPGGTSNTSKVQAS